ncbi:MAG: DUF3098 domain-containing protein [Saprospiraceae bacterium]
MSKSTSKKKVVVTTSKKAKPTVSRSKSGAAKAVGNRTLIFGKKNYILILAGILLIALGLILMSGGAMPSPDVWDDDLIYSTRRTVIAPFVIILGLIAEILAIFKYGDSDNASKTA